MKNDVDTIVQNLRADMAEKKQNWVRGRLLFRIVIALVELTIYLNIGYFIAGDIDRFCNGRVGSGFTEVVMGRSINYFCSPIADHKGQLSGWEYRVIQVTWPVVLLISAGDWLVLGVFQGGLIQLFNPWPN